MLPTFQHSAISRYSLIVMPFIRPSPNRNLLLGLLLTVTVKLAYFLVVTPGQGRAHMEKLRLLMQPLTGPFWCPTSGLETINE